MSYSRQGWEDWLSQSPDHLQGYTQRKWEEWLEALEPQRASKRRALAEAVLQHSSVEPPVAEAARRVLGPGELPGRRPDTGAAGRVLGPAELPETAKQPPTEQQLGGSCATTLQPQVPQQLPTGFTPAGPWFLPQQVGAPPVQPGPPQLGLPPAYVLPPHLLPPAHMVPPQLPARTVPPQPPACMAPPQAADTTQQPRLSELLAGEGEYAAQLLATRRVLRTVARFSSEADVALRDMARLVLPPHNRATWSDPNASQP